MTTQIVEKSGWQILTDLAKGGQKRVTETTTPVVDRIKDIVARPNIAYNPLSLSPGDLLVLYGVKEAEAMRFEVNKLYLSERTIGEVTIFSIDYELIDPTNETVGITVRALDGGAKGVNLMLLIPDGGLTYNEALEKSLDAMKPGDPEGFPNSGEEYAYFARPVGSANRYEVKSTEYNKESQKGSTEVRFCWDFVRDASHGEPFYFIEMSGEDGYFDVYKGRPLELKQVRTFRF